MYLPSKKRIPIAGGCAATALLVVLFYTPVLTTVWVSAVSTALVSASLLSRFPVRRLAPGGLRKAIIEGGNGGFPRVSQLDPGFASRFVRLFPEMTVIAACSFLAATIFGRRVQLFVAPEEANCTGPCVILATICAILAGRKMLFWKTEEFVLRARQHPAWLQMLRSRGVVLLCLVSIQLYFTAIPGVTKRGEWVGAPALLLYRAPVLKRILSTSGRVVLEEREVALGRRELWVRNRQKLELESKVTANPGLTAAVLSPDDAWLVAQYRDLTGTMIVQLFERANPPGDEMPAYIPARHGRDALAGAALHYYATVTGASSRLKQERPNVTATGWAIGESKLALTLTFEALSDAGRTDPWLCSYWPDRGTFEAVTVDKVQDASSREESVRVFIREVLQLQDRRALSALLERYDQLVTYYKESTPVDRAFISREKSRLFSSWPEAKCELLEPIAVSGPTEGGNWKVVLATRFWARHGVSGTLSEGEEQIGYTVRFVGDTPKIVAETSTVTRRGKGEKMPPAAPAVTRTDANRFPGERYPQTRERLLTESEVADWPPDKLRYAINEMFARCGAEMGKPELAKWFSQFSWYSVRSGVTLDDIERESFSEIERQNLKLLGAVRDRKRGSL